jgi:hypothetical protein
MSGDIRLLVKLLATLVLGFGLDVVGLVLTGAGECDRSDCPWYADVFDGDEASISFGACILLAGGVVWGVPLLFGQARRRATGR